MQILKTLSKNKLTSSLLASLLLVSANAETFEDYKAQYQQNFQKQKEAFAQYKKEQEKAFLDYKKELQKYWENPIINSKKELVSYSKDKKSRSIIDFKNNELTIETLAKDKKEAKQKLALSLAKAVTYNTTDFYNKDELVQKISKIETKQRMQHAKIDKKPVLAPLFFKKQPTKKSLLKLVKKELTSQKIVIKKSKKVADEKVYILSIKLPKNATVKRSRIYYKDVKLQAKKELLPISLIFAIMHSESSFNPMARSHVPAYGLMQIVPKTAGIDAYYYLYRQKRLVGSSYLYNANNNIKMGSAYLHILYYRYLRDIKDPQSRLYCTIAAYNTGAGNVSRAFVASYNTHKAAKVINKLTPDEVYAKLLEDLRYEEPKVYLKKVTKRMKMYQKIYEG
jgi:membrane-bound lytic murein transglycosylase C